MTLTTLTNPKEVVQTRYEHNITKYASSDREHKCSKENCDRLLVGEICRVAPSDVLSEAEWIWLIQSVDSFLDGGVLCKGDTDDSCFQWDNIPLFRVFFLSEWGFCTIFLQLGGRGDEPEHLGGLQARKTQGVEVAADRFDGCPVISVPRQMTHVQSQSCCTCW